MSQDRIDEQNFGRRAREERDAASKEPNQGNRMAHQRLALQYEEVAEGYEKLSRYRHVSTDPDTGPSAAS